MIFTSSLAFAEDSDVQQLSDVNSNFTQLQEDIDKSSNVYDLKTDHVYDDGFKTSGVNISRQMDIGGHDFGVDGGNKSTIFNVTSNVNFRNVIFSDSPNAVVSSGDSSVLFENCRFINAGVDFNGVNLTFKNCEFSQNSFIRANGSTVKVLASQFHDLRILDDAISINASEIIFEGNVFKNNIAYNLSADTLYTGGFASLVNISTGSVVMSNNRFKNNTVGILIHSVNGTDFKADGLTVEDTDFSAYNITNNIKKDISGMGMIFAGNFTNLEMTNVNITNIEASRTTSLININLTGNFSAINAEFSNLSCPYGIIEIYDNYTNPNRGHITFDGCSFKDIDTESNMTCYSYDEDKQEYIWEYCRGLGFGIKIGYNPDYSYWQYYAGYSSWDGYDYRNYLNKDLSFTNTRMENVEGGGYFVDFYANYLNITNFTVTDSRIGQYYDYGGHSYYSWGLVFNGFCGGNATLRDVLLDNVGVSDYNHTSYNATYGKYLCRDYFLSFGGVGFKIGSNATMDVYNVNITNCIGSYEGIFIFQSRDLFKADCILVENVTGGEIIESDKYYPDLDLETFNYDHFNAGLAVMSSEKGNATITNMIVKNSAFDGPAYYYGPEEDTFYAYGENLLIENMTFINFMSSTWGAMEFGGDNVTVKHFLMDDSRAYDIKNSSKYDEDLGMYVLKYSSTSFSPNIEISASATANVYDVNITNTEMGSDRLLAVSGDDVIMDSIIFENITGSQRTYITYDKQYGYLYEYGTFSGGYEGVLDCDPRCYMNISNMKISNVVATDLGNVAEIYLAAAIDNAYINLVNVTISNVYPLNENNTYFDKDVGQYISKKRLSECDGVFVISAGRGTLNLENVHADGINGFSDIFNLVGQTVSIINSTFENMSSYSYGLDFDKQRNVTVLTETNYGYMMDIDANNIEFINATFQNLTFSNTNYGSGVGIININQVSVYFEDARFINCTINPVYKKDYDFTTGEYEITLNGGTEGSLIYFDDYVYGNIYHTEFVNCSAIKGGVISLAEGYYSSLSVTGCKFISNSAEYGGSIYSGEDTYIYIYDSVFLNNTASQGGAICFDGGSNQISGCEFEYNRADCGSAVYCDGYVYISSSKFLNNQAKSTSLDYVLNITDDDINVEAVFKGADNFINAIYTSGSYSFYDLTYLSSRGEVNSNDENPLMSDLEDGINITLELWDSTFSVVKSVTNITVDGKVALTLPGNKNDRYLLVVKHPEDDYYTEISASSVIQIGQLDSPIVLKAEDIFYGENATITVQLPRDATGNVTFELDGVNFTAENLTEGFAKAVKSGLEGGIHNVTVYYSGDADYLSNSTKTIFTVNPVSSGIIVKTNGGDYKGDIQVNVTLTNGASGMVILVVEDKFGHTSTINVVDTSQIVINNLDAGSYNLTAYYIGSNNYLSSVNRTEFTVKPIDLNPAVSASNATLPENATFTITVPEDFLGSVNITVGNVSKVYDIEGSTQIVFVALEVGNKTANVSFFGDKNYNLACVYPVNFTVSENGGSHVFDAKTVNAEDMVRGYNSEFDYWAAFLDADGNALVNKMVEFAVGGKTYRVKTDDEGIAYLKDSHLAVGKYSVISRNTVTGEEVTRELTIAKRITENSDLTMDYLDGSVFRVKVWGDDGNIAPEGEIIDISANGVHYVCKVDKNGYASLKIKLLPKTYKITAEYKGFKTTNNLVIKQTLKAVKKTTKVKKGKKLVLKATLKWSNGKAIKGKKIAFKIKGKTFKAKTNKKGLAKVTIKPKFTKKLKKGKKYTVRIIYTVKQKYGNGKISQSDIVKCYVKVK